jgi:hypothetical protein
MLKNIWWPIGDYIDDSYAAALLTLKKTYAQPKFIYDMFYTYGTGLRTDAIYNLIKPSAAATLANAGIPVYQHIDGHTRPSIDSYFVYHNAADYAVLKKYVDDTLTNVPAISGFWLDAQISPDANWQTFYTTLIAYIRSKGKLVHFNFSASAINNFNNSYERALMDIVDGIFIENAGFQSPNSWETGLTPAIAANYPGKWIANCWGGAYASPSSPMPWSDVEADTLKAWSNGVDYFAGNPGPFENWNWLSHITEITNYLAAVTSPSAQTHTAALTSNISGLKFTNPAGVAPFQLTVNDQGEITVEVPN